MPWFTTRSPVKRRFIPFRKGVVGGVLVGEHGVAADRRKRAGHQDREFRGPPGLAEVRVPQLRQGSGCRTPHDARISFNRRHVGVGDDGAPPAGEGQVCLRG